MMKYRIDDGEVGDGRESGCRLDGQGKLPVAVGAD